MKHGNNLLIKAFVIILGIAVLIAAANAGGTLAQKTVISKRNEFYNISNTGTPASQEVPKPANTPVPSEALKPQEAQKPNGSTSDISSPAIPLEQTPDIPEVPAGPFDPEKSPKTDDNTDLKVLLTGMVIGVYMLRQTVFIRKKRGEG